MVEDSGQFTATVAWEYPKVRTARYIILRRPDVTVARAAVGTAAAPLRTTTYNRCAIQQGYIDTPHVFAPLWPEI